jgi:ankyrin repeat protein/predicted DNA-binding WGR domain protein
VKRNRNERSKDKLIEEDKSEKSNSEDEEELPVSLKGRKIKVIKKSKQDMKDGSEEEIEEKEIEAQKVSKSKKSKKPKSKGMIVDEDDDEEKPRAKSVPQKENKRGRKNKEESEDERDHSSDENYSSEEKKSKKKSKAKNAKNTKNSKSKPKKEVTKFKKGQFNPNVEILSSCKYMDSKEPQLYDECCVHCTNRNSFRAARTGNLNLLKKCIEEHQKVSSICNGWSRTYESSALEIAVKRGDKQMISEILKTLTNDEFQNKRVTEAAHKLSFIDTGENSVMAYGTKTRHLNMTRGNREGNNAFLEMSTNNWKNNLKLILLEECKDPKLIDYINAILTNPLNSNNNSFNSNYNQINFYNELHLAIRAGNKSVVHHLLGKIVNSKTLANYGYNELYFKVLDSKDDKFEVPRVTSMNKKSIGNATITPVHVASINPNEKILKRLIDLGADWHFMDNLNRKPIHYAAACEGPGPLKLLLDMGAHADEPDRQKNTPLMIACQLGRLANVKLLLKHNPRINLKSRSGNMALHEAALKGHREVIRLLAEEGKMKVDQPGRDRMTPLMMASMNGHKECVLDLIELGAKVTKKDKFKRTPLLLSCKSGQAVIASILLRNGSDFNQADSSSNSPLHYACAYGWLDIVDLLITAGADVNSTNMWKISPLEVAMLKNHFGIVKHLLNNSKVDVNMKFDKANTLLHHSFKGITHKSISEIEYLLKEKKADPNIQNLEGKSTMHLLAEYDYNTYKSLNCMNYNKLPKKYPASRMRMMNNNNNIIDQPDLDEFDEEKQNEENKNKDAHRLLIKTIFQTLIENGASTNLVTANSKTPLQIALETKNIPFIQEIMKSNPELLFTDANGQNILHLLTEYLFNKDSEEIMFGIVDKIFPLEDVKKIVNNIDDKGLTAILRLFYKYSIDVENFFNYLNKKETYKKKSHVYEQSLKIEENKSELKNESSNNFDDEGESDMEVISQEDEDMERKKPVKTVRVQPNALPIPVPSFNGLGNGNSLMQMSKALVSSGPTLSNWASNPGMNSVAINYGINQSDEITKHQKIISINLTPEDIQEVKEKSRGKLFEYIDQVFKRLVEAYVRLGCDVNAQVQKLKVWRDRKPGEEIPKEDPNANSNSKNDFSNRNSLNFNNNAFNPLTGRAQFKNPRQARAKAALIPPPEKQKKKKHDEAEEYLPKLGQANILMLFMTFPMGHITDYMLNNLRLDVNLVDIYKKNSLMYLIDSNIPIQNIFPEAFNKTIDQILAKNINVNQIDREGNSPFLMISKIWNAEIMEKLFNKGANVNQMNKKGENALLYYIRQKNKLNVDILLNKYKADINHKDERLRSAIHYIYNDEDSTADIDVSFKNILLSRNPDVNARDISGRTPLHYLFVKVGKEFDTSPIDPIVSLSTLLEFRGIQVDVQDVYGNTPLHYASQRGATISAMAIVEHLDINKKNFEGNSPLAYSLIFQQPNFSISLVQEKANIYDSAFLLKERNENLLVKKKRQENIKNGHVNTIQLQTLQTQMMSQFESVQVLENKISVKKVRINVSVKKQSSSMIIDDEELEKLEDQMEENDCDSQSGSSDSESEDEEEDLNYNNKSMNNQFNPTPAKAWGGKGFANNFNNINSPQVSIQNTSTSFNSHKDLNSKYFLTKEDKETGISLFRLCVKNGYQGLTYLFVNHGYDLMKAIQDSFYENKFNLAMLLLGKSPYDEIYRQINEKGQNLFHTLAIFGKAVSNKSDLEIFFEKLFEKGIPLEQEDLKGYTSLHYACENHFKDLTEFILKKTDPIKMGNITSKDGFTPFLCAIKGPYVSQATVFIDLLLPYTNKNQFRQIYLEESYGEKYKCTPIIHFTRHYLDNNNTKEPIFTEEGKIIIKLVNNGADPMEKDSDGLDSLMHCVKSNNLKLLELFVKNCKKNIKYNSVDNNGKCLVHYAVNPMEEGSYENEALLSFLLKNNFDWNIKDNKDKTPIDYALEQESGVNLRVFKNFKLINEESKVNRRKNSMIFVNEWSQYKYNFEEDAEMLHQIAMSECEKKEKVVLKPDAIGNFPADTHVLLHDNVNGYWDVTMTKVKVGAGLYGEYNFYKMQVIHDKGRDIFILWNRFGRIGDHGQSQRTPFTTMEEAMNEFKKIFRDKSGNEWENKSNFQRVKGKYMLLHFNENKINHKELLDSFDFKKCPESSIKQKEVRNLIKELSNTAIYFKALNESGIDTNEFNFNNLNKNLLISARSILGEINKFQTEIVSIKNSRNKDGNYPDDAVDKVLELKSQIYEYSSRYYELLPKNSFKNSAVRPLDNEKVLKEEMVILENLTYVEGAVKILLGAQFRQKEVNPLDYCLNSMNIMIENLKHDSNEFSLLKSYIKANNQTSEKILNIFRIQRKGEADEIMKWKCVPNHMLLFHGSKVFNFIGILSSGLKIAPPEAPATGYMFGKGVYFADMFDKSLAYCDYWEYEDEKGNKAKHKYMLMCEVVLGNVFEASQVNHFDAELSFLKSKLN